MGKAIKFNDELTQLLKLLKLPIIEQNYQTLAEQAEKEKAPYTQFLYELLLRESEYRNQKRIDRLIKDAKLPRDKLLSDFDMSRIPGLSPSQIHNLAQGKFIDHARNILLFGNPGTGKTHLSIALAREWCLLGIRVCFCTAASLVQQLIKAKSELKIDQFIKKLDRYEMLIIDDISYVPFKREETDLLFILLSARYEMRSLMITSNLPFSKWDSVFKDEMTTNAAIDRLVHHAFILELNTTSYRSECALKSQEKSNKQTKKKSEKEVQKV